MKINADSKGNILPDCYLLREGSTALDFAYSLHTDIGKNFIKAYSPVLIIEIHSAALGIEVCSLLLSMKYIVEVLEDISKDRCLIMAHRDAND